MFNGNGFEKVLDKIKRKYGNTLEKVLETYENLLNEYNSVEFSQDEIINLENKKAEILTCLSELATSLTESRKMIAFHLADKIRDELEMLDMPKVKFEIAVNPSDFSAKGRDDVEFLISTNISEEPKPLAKVASGGELSRIMLAIKSVFADKDDTDTLIFDEIDAGVSGRAAGKIARKLNDVSENRQVICITHLPSIAAFADEHMLISKAVKDEKTYTTVMPLDSDGRIAEIARIIGGNENDKAHLDSAKQLLQEADAYKTEGRV